MCQSLRSHSPLTSKPGFGAIVACDVAAGPTKNAQTEKCYVGQITSVKKEEEEEEESWILAPENIKPWIPTHPGYCVRRALSMFGVW